MPETTHFGYKQVPKSEKASKVAEVFDTVASKYDMMNDIMSLGIHRIWKRVAISKLGLRPGMSILDLAGGSGDLSLLMAKKLPNQVSITLADINNSMLAQARSRVLDAGLINTINICQADAQALSFPDNHFDRVIMAFGLRNVTDKDAALKEIQRVLKPGGECLILEFSKPNQAIEGLYDAYSFKILPKVGQLITGSSDSYQYLVESIRKHPTQEVLKEMMQSAGFSRVRFENLNLGIAAMHSGVKLC